MLVIIWSYIKIERRTTTTIISERVYRVIYDNEGEKKTKKENCYFFDNNDKKIQSGVQSCLFWKVAIFCMQQRNKKNATYMPHLKYCEQNC